MAKFDWDKISQDILDGVGGKSNIKSFLHCATRLRIEVYDDSKVAREKLAAVELAKGVNKQGEQWQIIFGAGIVNKVHDHFASYLKNMEGGGGTVVKTAPKKTFTWRADQGFWSNFFVNFRALIRGFADIFIPLIPVFVAGGMSLALSSLIGTITNDATEARAFFDLMGGAILGSLPAFVGYTAMKKFGGTPMLGLAIGLIMIGPGLLNGWSSGGNYVLAPFGTDDATWNMLRTQYIFGNNADIYNAFTNAGGVIDQATWTTTTLATVDGSTYDLITFASLQGLTVNTVNQMLPQLPEFLSFPFIGYQAQVFPVLGVIAVGFGIEKLMRKISPEAIAIVSVPLITVVATTFLGFWIVGPIGREIGYGITLAFQSIFRYTNWPGFGLGGLLLGFVYPFLVVTGLHQGFVAVEISIIAETAAAYGQSFTWITSIATVSNISQGMVGFAMAIILYAKSYRGSGSNALSGAVSANLGITEPILFGINVPLRFPMVAAALAAALGGYWVGMTHTVANSLGSASFLGFVQYSFVKPAELDAYFAGEGINAALTNLAPGIHIAIASGISAVAAFGFTFLFAWTPWGKKNIEANGVVAKKESATSRVSKRAQELRKSLKV